MDVDYARVPTHEQDVDLQRDALEAAGVEKIYWEKVSSRKEGRPELTISHTGLARASYLPRCPGA
jgi:DNA invertase Pin-like site-specific DNA recombinase